jgi:hypothetical protein
MRIEAEAYVEVKAGKIEIAVKLPDNVNIDEIDILSEELHFDVDRLPVWLVITFKKQKPSNNDTPRGRVVGCEVQVV